MIYDYLFFKSYQLAKRSENFEDIPVLGGMWGVMLGFMFNIFAVLLLLDGALGSSISSNKIFTVGRYIFAGLLVLFMFLYFKYNERWKKIVTKYEEKEKNRGIHPVIILIVYYILSASILLLSAMYKNGDGIFR